MSRGTWRALPFAELEEVARRRCRPELVGRVDQLAAVLGTTPRSIHRWRQAGAIPTHTADRLAINLGMHPVEIWGRAAWFEGVERGA